MRQPVLARHEQLPRHEQLSRHDHTRVRGLSALVALPNPPLLSSDSRTSDRAYQWTQRKRSSETSGCADQPR